MRDLLPALSGWYAAHAPFGLATVVAVSRSAPRDPGAAMAVGPDDEVVGSVSGGCVEGAVFELAREVVASREARLETFGYSDEDAFAVGLTCGGTLEVFIEPVSRRAFPQLPALLAALRTAEPVAVATVIAGPERAVGARLVVCPDGRSGTLDAGPGPLDDAVTRDVLVMLAHGATGLRRYGPEGDGRLTVFVQSFAPPPRLLVFGSTDFAAALTRQGALLGYRVTLCDARPVFATTARFPEADEVVVQWPHRYLAAEASGGRLDSRTVVAVLTHDPKFDVPLLEVALRLPQLAFVGAMGSRRTHEDRLRRLRGTGLTEAELARLSSPVGLDIGGRTPQETAVSIAAEIIARTRGGSGSPLAGTTGPIHTGPPVLIR
jgi:xanthine dehydrogenase accessory factor